MVTHAHANLFIPMATVSRLSVPPLGVTDGSSDPEWVGLRCRGGFRYARKPTLRIPFDAVTAATARRWVQFHRLDDMVLAPIFLALMLAGYALSVYGDVTGRRAYIWSLPLYLTALALAWWTKTVDQRLTVEQHPELVGRHGVYISCVDAVVAQKWVKRNPGVTVVEAKPAWRRYPTWVYAAASALCAATGAGIWVIGVRNWQAGLSPAASAPIAVLFGLAIVFAFKTLPPAFSHFGRGKSSGQ